jgi:hypothetical protein
LRGVLLRKDDVAISVVVGKDSEIATRSLS